MRLNNRSLKWLLAITLCIAALGNSVAQVEEELNAEFEGIQSYAGDAASSDSTAGGALPHSVNILFCIQ